MRLTVAIVSVLVLAPVHADEVLLRGELTWTSDQQTLRVCDTGEVYWVRVLASNPWFLLTKKVEAASVETGSVTAELRGEITSGHPSSGPKYPVDGTLSVSAIESVTQGNCEAQKHNKNNGADAVKLMLALTCRARAAHCCR
jgi:hypothetical protein